MRVKKNIRCWKEFFVENILRTPERELNGVWFALRNFVRVIRITAEHFLSDELQLRASALTYSTLLSIVPMLALLFSIAGGFGYKNIIESQLFSYFPAQKDALTTAMGFVESYLKESRSGIFLGIGIIFLFWSVINLLSLIERTMNKIWQTKERSLYRKINDYTSIFIIIPILMVLSAGISVFMTTFINQERETLLFITPIIYKTIEISPYIITILFFTIAYLLIPNTKVKFKYAFIAGIVCGSAFQIFQYLYLNGQIWVSKYNAIYGSFAFLPLLLLWLQLSWLIFLFGTLLSFSMQNLDYANENDMRHISRQYKDFITLLIACVIVQRFDKKLPPLTTQKIANSYSIPMKLTSQVLQSLLHAGIINETLNGDERVPAFQPAFDISKLSVGTLFNKIDTDGTGEKSFRINRNSKFRLQWDTVVAARNSIGNDGSDKLIKDIIIEQPLKTKKL